MIRRQYITRCSEDNTSRIGYAGRHFELLDEALTKMEGVFHLVDTGPAAEGGGQGRTLRECYARQSVALAERKLSTGLFGEVMLRRTEVNRFPH